MAWRGQREKHILERRREVVLPREKHYSMES